VASNAQVMAPIAGTQSEYARHRKALNLPGGTAARVSQKQKSGALAEAMRPDGLIDFQIADRIWTASPRIEHYAAGPLPGGSNLIDGESFMAVKTRRERAEAEMAETKAAKQRGALIERAEAQRAWTAIGRMHGQALQGIPVSLAPRLTGKTDIAEIEVILKAEINGLRTRVADEISARYGKMVGA
jgi:hypothetical protein